MRSAGRNLITASTQQPSDQETQGRHGTAGRGRVLISRSPQAARPPAPPPRPVLRPRRRARTRARASCTAGPACPADQLGLTNAARSAAVGVKYLISSSPVISGYERSCSSENIFSDNAPPLPAVPDETGTNVAAVMLTCRRRSSAYIYAGQRLLRWKFLHCYRRPWTVTCSTTSAAARHSPTSRPCPPTARERETGKLIMALTLRARAGVTVAPETPGAPRTRATSPVGNKSVVSMSSTG